MKYVEEYRDPILAKQLLGEINAAVTKPWSLMEVCGGQTHTIVRQGIDDLLPAGLRMVHGPGCPVCVTPLELIDKACAIAARPDVIFTSYGDMLRVPGSQTDLLALKARGSDVRTVYSPMDAVRIAIDTPDRQVVFFAVGFETTAPANAMAVMQAKELGLRNFSVLVSHVLVPPAMTAILDDPECGIDAFLAAGHVCAVMGWREYEPIVERYQVPIIVTGFEPLDLLEGILMAVRQLEAGRAAVENQYIRAVQRLGNTHAQNAIRRVFADHRPHVARRGINPRQRADALPGIRRIRCCDPVRRRRHCDGRAPCLHRRRHPARSQDTYRLHGLRNAVHAADATRCADGVERRNVRCVLQRGPRASSPFG